jgi:hypothetical protein
MPELVNNLPAIEPASLLEPLRRLTNSATAEPMAWQVEQLGGGFGNPVSLGLYRVSGQAMDSECVFSWSLILKAAQSPANVGMPDLGGGDDPAHWNYWRRECRLYPSGLLDRLPPGVAAPCHYGIEDRPGNVFWLWLEEITDSYQGNWPVARYGLAARHLGRLSAVYLTGRQLADYPWLAQSTLRQWLTGPLSIASQLAKSEGLSEFLGHPVLGRLFPGGEVEMLKRCILNIERLLDALDHLPQTLGHQDAYPTNLMSRPGDDGQEETVALDWALAGVAPIGSDLAQLFIGLVQNHEDLPANETEKLVMDGYLAGLIDMSWAGDERNVWFGFAATTLLRLTFLLIFYLQGGSTAEVAEPPAAEATDDLVPQLAALARLLKHLAPQVFVVMSTFSSDH